MFIFSSTVKVWVHLQLDLFILFPVNLCIFLLEMPFACRSGLTLNATGEESRLALCSNPPLPSQLSFPRKTPRAQRLHSRGRRQSQRRGDKQFSDSRKPDLSSVCGQGREQP